MMRSKTLNTIKTERSIYRQFKEFCDVRNYQLNESTRKEELAKILKDWASNMRKTDGTEYKEGVVKTMWNITAKMIQDRYLKDYNRHVNPFTDIAFKSARDAKNTKRRHLQSIPGKRKTSSVQLKPEEIQKIINLFDENNPNGLQRKFYHIATMELSWRVPEAVLCTLGNFKEEINESGVKTGRIRYNSHPDSVSRWLTPNTNNVNQCPVRLYHKLLSKRPKTINTSRFFLAVNKSWNLNRNSLWYKNAHQGINEIRKWTKSAAEAIGLDTKKIKITNLSNRSTTVSQLTRARTSIQESINIMDTHTSSSIQPHVNLNEVNNLRKDDLMVETTSSVSSTSENFGNQFKMENLCRICMLPNAAINIHTTQIEENFLIDILLQLATIDKKSSHHFKFICNKCCIKITSFHAFRERILDSEKVLTETYLKENNSKQIELSDEITIMDDRNCSEVSEEVFTQSGSLTNLNTEEMEINSNIIDTSNDSTGSHHSDEILSEFYLDDLKTEKIDEEMNGLEGSMKEIKNEIMNSPTDSTDDDIYHLNVYSSEIDFIDSSDLAHINNPLENNSEHFTTYADTQICHLCGNVYIGKHLLNRHLEEKHKIISPNCTGIEEAVEVPVTKLHTCQICFKPFQNRHKLDLHLLDSHTTHSADKRFGDKLEGEIKEKMKKAIPINTKKSQASVWRQFLFFCQDKEYKLEETTTPEDLSLILTSWAANMKRKNGSDYKENVVKQMWNMTAKLLQEMYFNKWKITINPFTDVVFKSARAVRDAKRKILKASLGIKIRTTSLIVSQSEFIEHTSLFDEETPDGLQKKFFIIASRQLLWVGGEGANCLKYYFREMDGVSDRVEVEYNPLFSESYEGAELPGTKRLLPNTENPQVCPVRLFKKFMSKRGSNIKTNRLFVTPNPYWKNGLWYKNIPLSTNEARKWMKSITEEICLDIKGKYRSIKPKPSVGEPLPVS